MTQPAAGLDETQPAPTPAAAPAKASASDPLDRTATMPQGLTVPPAPTTGIASGHRLDHFQVERPLGAGGMGEVYLATDLALDRSVAIKVLPQSVAADSRRRDRLVREAQQQAKVSHQNVAHIYFVGEADDRIYFAMELVGGKTLSEMIATAPLSVEEALAVIRGAVQGLREAHRQGITHRDIKPSNLMVDAHGVVKVLDFGLAAGGLDASERGGPVAQTSLAGTPLYMAPEQARGEPVDHRTDIYSLGATLYHLVTGKPPFGADSVDELVSLHATAARPGVAGKRRGLSRTEIRNVDALCARMMATDPAQRFASYDELLLALELASVAETRPGGFFARSLAAGIDAVLLTLLYALALFAIRGSGGDVEISMGDSLFQLVLFVYTVVLHARWGRTVGKAIVELEVVDVDTGQRPTWRRSIARSAIPLGIPAILALLQALNTPASGLFKLVGGVLAVSMFGFLFAAAVSYPSKRTIWDRAGRTLVRYRAPKPTLSSR